ncbi:hypothetical protein Bra471DRAFT_05412 [Bradyrhizobium sp. WSM471]|nr:hypothetical protein Bra471DRAFT_05412 [Bradyrhizobium sp. WSM471]
MLRHTLWLKVDVHHEATDTPSRVSTRDAIMKLQSPFHAVFRKLNEPRRIAAADDALTSF